MLGRMGLLYRSDEAVEYEGDAAARMTKNERELRVSQRNKDTAQNMS